MNPRIPQQATAIKTWAEERDSLLREIAVHSVELEEKTRQNKEAGATYTDLQNSISEARGRIAELDALEERKRNSVATDVAELEARKSRLESECAALDTKALEALNRYEDVVEATKVLQSAHDTMKDQAAIVNKVTGDLVETSTTHLSQAKTLMVEIRAISEKMIEKGNANIAQTDIVLGKLPKYIFELQKPIPLRRTYATPRGAVIEPDK